MSQFKPYSVTRGGFSTPRELFLSVVKDLTQFYTDGDNPFEVKYPADPTDLDYDDANSDVNDVVVIQATGHVDPCVDDTTAQQPWLLRFDTRASIGHGNGHINVTTPLQIDWSKPKAPAIPYIPPNVPYDPDSIYTEGTLGFVGMRVPDGAGTQAASNERGFINRAVYHTNVKQVQNADEFGNLLWDLVPVAGGTPVRVNGSRRIVPEAAFDSEGLTAYKIVLTWSELTNASEIDVSATYPSGSWAVTSPNESEVAMADGMAPPEYAQRSCTLYFKGDSGLSEAAVAQSPITTYAVSGSLPPSLAETAVSGTPRDEDNIPQQLKFTYGTEFPEFTSYDVVRKTQKKSTYQNEYQYAWEALDHSNAAWKLTETKVTNIESLSAESNHGVEIYDNTRYELTPVSTNTFDASGAAKDPREGALNVPMSYALTVSDHGIVLATWDQAVDQYETNEGHRFGWLVAQRLVDKDTGAPLVDQTKSFCPLYCVYGVYHEKLATSMYFVVRESDVHRPSEEQLAGEDGPDSNAVLNTFEQIAVSEDYEYVITVPSGLTTQRYLYLEEADLIGYTSADVISNGALSEFQMYDEGECSITGITAESDCLAQGGSWESATRLYKGLPATGKYNTGMRVLMRWYGGRLGSESTGNAY